MPLPLLLSLLACQPGAPVDPRAPVSADSPTDSSADSEDAACREEGEACVAYEESGSNCCNGRHTCFPEGCYYSQP